MSSQVAVIINPISGTGGRVDIARDRAEKAAALIALRGCDAQVFMTARPGHARELALAALDRGVTTVLAWGGDGTVNEVASVLAFRDATLAVIPSGSGNGLARELHIPLDVSRAFEIAFDGRTCRIDAGELDRRLFFNVAGIGLDARVAHRFAAGGLVRRGLFRYVEIAAQELFRDEPSYHTVVTDGRSVRVQVMLITIANGRQFGNGAVIAPAAKLDDGLLDVVVVARRSPLAAMLHAPRLFTEQIHRAPGVTSISATDIAVTSEQPMVYHVDGEPFVGGCSITARPHPGALRIKVSSTERLDVLGYQKEESSVAR